MGGGAQSTTLLLADRHRVLWAVSVGPAWQRGAQWPCRGASHSNREISRRLPRAHSRADGNAFDSAQMYHPCTRMQCCAS